ISPSTPSAMPRLRSRPAASRRWPSRARAAPPPCRTCRRSANSGCRASTGCSCRSRRWRRPARRSRSSRRSIARFSTDRTSPTSRIVWRRAPTSRDACRPSRRWLSSTRITKTGRRSCKRPASAWARDNRGRPMHPPTNYAPPFNITRASHLVFTARDLKASRAFYTEVVGLVVSDEDDNTIWMHGVEERCHHSLTLKKTKSEAVCERVGFRVFTDEDLTKAKAHFDANGIESRFVDVPYQGRTLHVDDAAGTPLELVATQPTHLRTQTKTNTHKGAAALRMDHYQVLVPDVNAAAKFYLDLGFRTSDYYVANNEKVVGIFMYRKTNPHDMVFLQRSGPRFHHYGYMVQEMHHVVRA